MARYKLSPICASQVACDGNRVLVEGRTCDSCLRRMAAKSRKPLPLKGSRTELTKAELRELQGAP